MKRIDGTVAFITGASSGIGAALAEEFARRGADVVLAARRADRLEEVAARVRGHGRRALVVTCDVTRDGDLEAPVAQGLAGLGRLDRVVANAGFGVPLLETGMLQGLNELTITGQTGPPGTGNYKGLWIDSIRFESLAVPRLPLPAGEGELPGRWQPGTWLTTSSPRRKGLAIAVPASKDRVEACVLLRRTFDPPVATTGNDLCCVWIMAHQHVGPLQLALVDERGGRLKADLCQLADDRPLRLGMWYCILWPWRAALPKITDVPRWTGFEVVSAAGTSVGEGTLALCGPTFTTVELACKNP